MGKGLSYVLGILTGVLITFAVLAIWGNSTKDVAEGSKKTKLPEGVSLLDEPVPFTETENFKVLQVVFSDGALAQSEKRMQYSGSSYYTDPVVLIITDKANSFYDDQIIKAPKGSKVMQVGTYNYNSALGSKTVPIIRFTVE